MSITITEVRNAVSRNSDNTEFDLEINHPDYGWIPYYLTSDDTDTTIDNNLLLKLIGFDFTKITQEKLDEEQSNLVRMQRDVLLETEVDPIINNQFRWDDLTTEKQNEWKQYRTDLLNVPQQSSFPNDVTFPTKPN